jgi:hypothetical protein
MAQTSGITARETISDILVNTLFLFSLLSFLGQYLLKIVPYESFAPDGTGQGSDLDKNV